MRPLLLALCLALPASAAETQAPADWGQPLDAGAKAVIKQAGQLRSSSVLSDGRGLRCLRFGQRTEQIPSFDPIHGACRLKEDGSHDDPLPDPAQAKAAFDALVKKVIEKGNLLTDSAGAQQRAIGRGNPDPDSLSEEKHWTDFAYLRYRREGAAWVPAEIILKTVRGYRSGAQLKAQWVTFSADMEGKLGTVISNNGELSPRTQKMMWVQNGQQVRRNPGAGHDVYELFWRQLLASWSE